MIENSVSIIIPVKNGMPHLRSVFTAIAMQEYDGPVDVTCIDSGSKDGSLKVITNNGADLIQISPQDFGHGRTRNFAAQKSRAQYLVFLTQDAIPNDPNWLAELIRPMREDANIAGVFSRHIAHENADPFTRWELEETFSELSKYPVVELSDAQTYYADQSMRQTYHFFSDNSSAIRRSVWKKFPLPDVQFAEDQIWAKTIIEAGYKKAYAHASVVRHSHSFGPYEALRRSFDESHAFRNLFDYRLITTKYALFQSIIYLLRRDLKNALRNGWCFSHPLKTTSRIFESITKPLGHYLGARQTLSSKWQSRLSRDNWIRSLQ